MDTYEKFESSELEFACNQKEKYLGYVSKPTIFNKYREGMQEENEEVWCEFQKTFIPETY
jgi:hypothetical protein